MQRRDSVTPETSVEVLTFNMNKNPLALGDVMSSLKKNTDLIVICLQESTEYLNICNRRLSSFLEHYQCIYEAEHGSLPIGKLQIFVLKNRDVSEHFTFSHKSMRFSLDSFDYQLYRPWKGAIFLKCDSQNFRHPMLLIGTHFHAHDGQKYVLQREKDLKQILGFIKVHYPKCDWCLFGDLNFRSSENSNDEFQPYFNKYNIKEYLYFEGARGSNTYKIDMNHRNEFDKHRRPSRTDRICHNATSDIKIDQYAVVKRSGDADTPAGAGSDHYPVFEVFRIPHHATSPSAPFMVYHM